MASAEALAKLETKAVAAEKLIELLRQQISQVSGLRIEVPSPRKTPKPKIKDGPINKLCLNHSFGLTVFFFYF